MSNYCHRDTPFMLITRSDICQNATDDAGIVRMGTFTTESHRDLSTHPSAFQQRHHQPSRKNPRLCFFFFFFKWVQSSASSRPSAPQTPAPNMDTWVGHRQIKTKRRKTAGTDALHVSTESSMVGHWTGTWEIGVLLLRHPGRGVPLFVTFKKHFL